MACTITCMISAVFILGMIYFYYKTENIVKRYKVNLSLDLQQRYTRIAKERRTLSYQGYVLGVVLSLFLFYNRIKVNMRTFPLVCTVMATCFLTQYFYYILHPKTDWMLTHMNTRKEVQSWLQMYREMQYHYHMGVVLGVIAVGIFAFAFRC